MDAMESLTEEMRELSKQHSMSPKELKNPNNKWLVRSAFQKYMRRGRADDAIRMAEYLFSLDEKYAWYTLQTILIEDIGLGDLDLMSYGTMANLKGVRDQMSSSAGLFASMVVRACAADKSRACCELSLGADLAAGPVFAELKDAGEAALLTAISSADPERAYVGLKVQRKNLRGGSTEEMMPTLQLIYDALDGQDETVKRACLLNFERTVDTMNLALFPVVRGDLADHSEWTANDEMPPEIQILSVTSAAFDMHVMQGKRALKAFWRGLCKVDPMFADIPEDDAVKAVGSLVFIVEGGQVDHRLMSNFLKQMKVYQDTNFPPGYGLPKTIDLQKALDVVRKNIPLLNEKRLWSCK